MVEPAEIPSIQIAHPERMYCPVCSRDSGAVVKREGPRVRDGKLYCPKCGAELTTQTDAMMAIHCEEYSDDS